MRGGDRRGAAALGGSRPPPRRRPLPDAPRSASERVGRRPRPRAARRGRRRIRGARSAGPRGRRARGGPVLMSSWKQQAVIDAPVADVEIGVEPLETKTGLRGRAAAVLHTKSFLRRQVEKLLDSLRGAAAREPAVRS